MDSAGPDPGVDADQARRIAQDHMARRYESWPRSIVAGDITRSDDCWIVPLMLENVYGMLNFVVVYRVWVEAASGVVKKTE